MSDITISNTGVKDLVLNKELNAVRFIGIPDSSIGILADNTLYQGLKADDIFLTPGITAATFRGHLRQINKVANRNKITDKDKVFFTKASLFPRTSFNRYSKKARLVQKIPAATKFVVPEVINTSVVQVPVYTFKATDGGEDALVHIKNTSFAQAIREHDYNITYSKYPAAVDANPSYYGRLELTQDLVGMVVDYLESVYPGRTFNRVDFDEQHLLRMRGYSLKEAATLHIYMQGIPISSFVTDTVANKYIEEFKGEFDEGTMKYLVEMLNSPGADPEVAMQLICNTKMREFEPKLHSLLLQLTRAAFSKINDHKVMNTVDVINLVKTHNLTSYFNNYYDMDNLVTAKVSYILKNDDISASLKKEFAVLLNKRFSKALSERIGMDYNLIKITYEDIEI